MRTISEPARANAATCPAVAATSAVSVLVIDWTTTGAPPPTVTWPTLTGTDVRLGSGAAEADIDFSIAIEVPDGGPPVNGGRTMAGAGPDAARRVPVYSLFICWLRLIYAGR
jgi:hypothetical protein